MDFINPHKQRLYKIQLMIGYFLIAVAIFLTTLVLLFLAYGYSLGKDGQVVQNGLVFVSSSPNPAKIYLNGVLNSSSTNSRLQLPAGQYTLKLTRDGYRPWVRALGVEGGSVEHFDYPFLFPTKLVTTDVQQYNAVPGLVLQSPDQHWLLVQRPGSPTDFDKYDLTDPKHLASTRTTVSIPTGILTDPGPTDGWQLEEWSTDNKHVILKHIYGGGSEYILFDTDSPDDSVNLTQTLHLGAGTQLVLDNKKYDKYYLFDPAAGSLATMGLTDASAQPVLSHVLAFKSYGSNVVLYATSAKAPAGEANIDVLDGSKNYVIRRVPGDSTYLLNLTQYSGNWYVAAGASSENEIYVYENPMSALGDQPGQPLVPISILKVYQPDYLDFSANAQFIVAEGGNSFAVYDAENEKSYNYTSRASVPAGQHATWMDGDRLMIASGGKAEVWDYDGANEQTLQPAVDGSVPAFDPSYKWMYVIAPSSKGDPNNPYALSSTALRVPADQ